MSASSQKRTLGLFRPKTLDRLDRYELPDLDHFLRPAAVQVIAIPLAFRRHRLARRGSDKRSSRSKLDMDISSPPADFLLEKKIETDRPMNFFQPKKFSRKRETHLYRLGANSRQ